MTYNIDDLTDGIKELARGQADIGIMEVCGTHTASIRRFGIPALLPENIRLVSGPGCPVCVTSQRDIASAFDITENSGVIFTCFGDMLRITCEKGSLYSLYEKGRVSLHFQTNISIR